MTVTIDELDDAARATIDESDLWTCRLCRREFVGVPARVFGPRYRSPDGLPTYECGMCGDEGRTPD